MQILVTDRLRLRWFEESDDRFTLALVNDPAWLANIGDRGLRAASDARQWIADKLRGHYFEHGHGLWLVERRDSGEPVGMCGLLQRNSLPTIDVGYAIAAAHRGRGYAREAAAACLDYARDVLACRQVVAVVKPDNRASVAVLQAIGMTSGGTHLVDGEQTPDALFHWGAPDDEDAASEIAALSRRLFAYFSQRGGHTDVAAVPSLFVSGARVIILRPGVTGGMEVLGVKEFLEPRAELLTSGRLVDFEEREVSGETVIDGNLAHRRVRYEKSGVLDGEPLSGRGHKHLQLVRTRRGFRIAALVWEDEPAVAPDPSPA
jgi:RimJ/RimL family protein N-acetyltransferase